MKIVVLGGGISTERHVSLVSGTSVCKALRERGHKAIFVDMFLGLEDYEGSLADAFDAPDGFCGKVSIGKEAPDIQAVIASRKYKSPSRIGKKPVNALPESGIFRQVKARILIKKLFRLCLRRLQNLDVCTEIRNMHFRQAVLSGAEKIARAAQPQILLGYFEAVVCPRHYTEPAPDLLTAGI